MPSFQCFEDSSYTQYISILSGGKVVRAVRFSLRVNRLLSRPSPSSSKAMATNHVPKSPASSRSAEAKGFERACRPALRSPPSRDPHVEPKPFPRPGSTRTSGHHQPLAHLFGASFDAVKRPAAWPSVRPCHKITPILDLCSWVGLYHGLDDHL